MNSNITGDHLFDIITAPNRDSLHWTAGQVAWEDIVDMMVSPANKKACGNYVLGKFTETTVKHKPTDQPCTNLHRKKTAVRSRGALTLDVDYPGEAFRRRVADMPYASIIHTTYSSTEDEPRYRLIVPLSRKVSPDEYHAAAAALMHDLGKEQFDPGSTQAERYMFKPSESAKGRFWYNVQEGPLADVEGLLASFETDLSALPIPKAGRTKRDPFAIEGTIGAFNRAYEDFADLIQEYQLPYEDAGSDRWQLVGASAAAGMGLCAPGLVFSHHANDPAYGQTCSAFDLVRLHMFGELDEKAKPGTPVNKLPSTLAMQEVATQDLRVVTELVGADFAADMSAVADDVDNDSKPKKPSTTSDWRVGLQRNTRTGEPIDNGSNWDLIVANDPSFAGLLYNELNMAIETDKDLPWRKVGDRPTFDQSDRELLYLHIEREYGFRTTDVYLNKRVTAKAQKRRINPIKDYLDTLEWDGKPRLEGCLPGVKETPFTRLVARKSMVAAVARAYEPGCKWDHMLVLFGPEGLGKSYWIDKISRGHSISLGRIQDKDTLVTMQRAWIMTSDEGHSLRKADFDAQKEFLTRTVDVFRAPYEREAMAHPRHCVIWGTTNDEVFLRRQEGNRRFLIVQCEDKVDFDLLTDEYVDQVWAEARHLYLAGEQLWLSEEESALAADAREAFTEEDVNVGLIGKYLDTLVPSDWDTTTPEDRQMWLMNSGDGMTAAGTERIDLVCSKQLWVEALKGRMDHNRKTDLRELAEAMKQMPGWVKVGNRYFKQYGPQMAFQRLESIEGHDLI